MSECNEIQSQAFKSFIAENFIWHKEISEFARNSEFV